jgi:hypothetical protein
MVFCCQALHNGDLFWLLVAGGNLKSDYYTMIFLAKSLLNI